MATNGYGAPPAYNDAPPSYANVQSGTPAQPVQYGQPVQYTQPAQPVQPAAGQIVYIQGQPMMVAQVVQQPAQGQMGQVSSVPMQNIPSASVGAQAYYPNVGGAAPAATVAYNNNYNVNTTAPGGIPGTVGSGVGSYNTSGGEPGASVVTTAVVVGQVGGRQGYSCSGPSGLDGDTRSMGHYCGVLITVCIMACLMSILDSVDELAIEEFNYYDDYYYSSYYDYSFEYRFGAEEVEITYDYWYFDNTVSYSSLCNDDDNDYSDYWCDIKDKGISWITWLAIADVCWLIAIIFLSLIACCGPRGCCSCGNDCGKGCNNDKNCCKGFCAKNTAIWALIGYSTFAIIGCIGWITDNPIQDDDFCEDCDIEWGSTWYTALAMAIINIICVVVLALPDCACCRCS